MDFNLNLREHKDLSLCGKVKIIPSFNLEPTSFFQNLQTISKLTSQIQKEAEAMLVIDNSVITPPSFLITAMSAVSLVMLTLMAISEVMGKHLKYSKFWNVNSSGKSAIKEVKLSSRTGMLIFYTPALLGALASFWIFPHRSFRFLLLTSALAFHFFKRDFEVLFIHKYSGGVMLDSTIFIGALYFAATVMLVYFQHLSEELAEPRLDMKYFGLIVFLLGISGNFYHHYLLSKMRKDGEKQYKIPKGGLFDKVVCPHYLFEIITFWGFFLISQNLYAICCAIGVTFYLTARSNATRKWYLSKFENFPHDVKAVFPYVF